MTASPTPTPPRGCLAAPDRYPTKGPVALPPFPFVVHRPAPTTQARGVAAAEETII